MFLSEGNFLNFLTAHHDSKAISLWLPLRTTHTFPLWPLNIYFYDLKKYISPTRLNKLLEVRDQDFYDDYMPTSLYKVWYLEVVYEQRNMLKGKFKKG